MNARRIISCLIALELLVASAAFNEVQGATVTTKQLKETTVKYNNKREKVICLGIVPGSISVRSQRITFTSFSNTLSKTPRSSTSKYNRLKALISLGSKECKRISKVPPGSPTPSKTPTPTPTATPQTGNFDVQGNVTPAGKILFGIPSALSANVTAGKAVQTAKCTGCHEERIGRTFLDIRTNIQRSPMLYDEAQIPDAMLANIIAYLNRFRP